MSWNAIFKTPQHLETWDIQAIHPISPEIYVMPKKSSWVKKCHSETSQAKAQQQHRRRRGLFKKAVEFCLGCKSNVFVAIWVQNTRQMYILDSSSRSQWLGILSDLVYSISFLSIPKLTLIDILLSSSNPGGNRRYHTSTWAFVRSGRRINFLIKRHGSGLGSLLVNFYLVNLPLYLVH